MKKFEKIVTVVLFALISLTIACEPNEAAKNCFNLHPCNYASFVIVNSNTFESLIGDELKIHPDSIVILNDRLDTMYHSIEKFLTYQYISRFNPFQEITCFNQCLSDSAFSRYYYLYVGNGDMDTIEVHFPANQEYTTIYEFYFNGESGNIPDDPKSEDYGGFPYMFRKKIE